MITITWCNDANQADELATFFAEQIRPQPEFISHQEIQGGRAKNETDWSPDLDDIFKREIKQRLIQNDSLKRVAAARQDDVLVAIAYVSFTFDVPTPYAILEDIVVRGDKRGTGIGSTFLDWIFQCVRDAGVRRVFLESGKQNHAAHHFFERSFRPISVVMMAELTD